MNASQRPEKSAIVPRWEWRTFAPHPGAADERFAVLTPTKFEESDELYLLSSGGDTVKVRNGLIDIKVLKQVNAEGLEQWVPMMKAPFPLQAADAAKMFGALRVDLDATTLSQDAYALDQLLDELLSPSGAVRAVQVHKRRTRYAIGKCPGEVTEVTADGRHARTIAIESEDPEAVIAAVRELGLRDYVNTSYPRGLGALIDNVTPRYAVIDVGTNSVKFHIGERADDGTRRTFADRAEVTRLGEGLEESGEIQPDALERTAAAIRDVVEEAKQAGVLAIAAVGTAGLRRARNSDAVLAAIRKQAGVRVEIIPGEEEGRLAYLAVREGLGLGEGSLVTFDTGGGSTQFSFGHNARVDEMFSVEVGAVRYTERFRLASAVAPQVLRDVFAAISADLTRIDGRTAPDKLVGMGGAVTNLAAVKHALSSYDPDVIQGTALDRAEIDRQIELYRSRDAAARREIVGLQPKRADIILAGACIVRTIMDKLRRVSLIVSDHGLRHGLLLERFGQSKR